MTAWLFLWLFWFINEALSAAYVVCALITFRNVQTAKKYTYNADAYDVNAVLAALFLGVVIVILFFVVSLVLLLKNAVNHEALSGFGNGILLSSSFHTAIFSLLTALVVYSAKSLFSTWERNPNVQWNSGDTAAYDATYVLAFMMAGTYLVYSILILVLRNVFVREEAQGKLKPASGTAPAATTAPAYTEPTKPATAAPAATAPARRGWFGRKKNTSAAAEPGLPTTNTPHTPGAPVPATGAAAATATAPHMGQTAAATPAADAPIADAPAQRAGGAWNAAGETAV